eukprot:4703111-Alexandrium_andersonii.AAC.1
MLVQAAQLGLSRCTGPRTEDDWPSARVRTPAKRLSVAPSERPPKGHCAMVEDGSSEQLGAPRSGAP